MKKAIFLFDYTGIMAKPWADAGYLCYCFDGQHRPGVTTGCHDNILNVGMWLNNSHCEQFKPQYRDIKEILRLVGFGVDFIFGFPECTDLAVSGASHFKKKKEKNPRFQDEAMALVSLTRLLGESLKKPWALENPISVISTMWRKPDYKFDPFEYGGYLPKDDVHPTYPEYIKPRDAYPKKTCIWSGNGFVMPEKKPVEVEPGYSDQHKKLGGKSLKTKNIRSATPRGFAKAVFEANSR
ncbi:MAG: Dcm methylase [Aliivibrio sp.]|nr:Dcm methylase [Aliivibrio sp.]MCP4323335.1 Dcm methylase [Alteromonadales bacterium]